MTRRLVALFAVAEILYGSYFLIDGPVDTNERVLAIACVVAGSIGLGWLAVDALWNLWRQRNTR